MSSSIAPDVQGCALVVIAILIICLGVGKCSKMANEGKAKLIHEMAEAAKDGVKISVGGVDGVYVSFSTPAPKK